MMKLKLNLFSKLTKLKAYTIFLDYVKTQFSVYIQSQLSLLVDKIVKSVKK